MIVLDTHAWIWWVDDHPRLNPSVRDRIDLEDDVRICAISLLEISTAVSLGRLALPGGFHRDPADRLIVALARLLDAPLVTADQKILAYPSVVTIEAGRQRL